MKTSYLTIIAIFLMGNMLAQGQELKENLSILKENTVQVTSKKTDYQQTFSHDPTNHYLLSVSITDTKKGNETVQTVNAIDLNSYQIKFQPKGDLVEITAAVNGGKYLVKITEIGEIKNYNDEVLFYASGIEEARKLTDALKKIVEHANNNPSVVAVSNDKQDLLDEIAGSVKDVNINDNIYVQSFSYGGNSNNMVTFELNNAAGDNVEHYTLNISDLNLHKIDFFTKRTDILIPLPVKGDKNLIAYTKNGEIGNYTNKLEIRVPSIEEARLLEAQLEALVAVAENEEAVDYSKYSTAECVAILTEKIGEVVINQDAYRQEFKIDPENDLIFIYTLEDVSKGNRYEYIVNAADFGSTPVNFNTSRNSIFVELKISGDRDLIRVLENAEKTSYQKNLSVRIPDIESAREIAGVFKHFNQLASKKMEGITAFENLPDAENFLLNAVEQVVVGTDTYLQTIENGGSEECLMKYNLTDVSKDTQYEYEFNFKDVDPNKIQFTTSRAEALVSIEIKGSNKLVKSYKNGEVDKFISGFQIKAKDVEQARKLEIALKMITGSCAGL